MPNVQNPFQTLDADGQTIGSSSPTTGPSLIPPQFPMPGVDNTNLRARLEHFRTLQNNEPRSTYMQAFAETSAPLWLQSTDVWTPPYSCTRHTIPITCLLCYTILSSRLHTDKLIIQWARQFHQKLYPKPLECHYSGKSLRRTTG